MTFLFPKSVSYSQDSLQQALNLVDRFQANYGGTETFSAVKDCLEKRLKDMSTELMLITDGDIWNQDELFKYIKEKVDQSQGNIRVFTLGIGNGVSHALIEGVARAGNGFSQAVILGERLDNKIVKMLKGSLTPHVTDLTFEVKYKESSESDDEFEMIEKVADSLNITLTFEEDEGATKQISSRKISLFGSKEDVEMQDAENQDNAAKDPYAHLPKVAIPKFIQTPYRIRPFFPGQRNTVYLLMSPETAHLTPVSIVLKGTSPQGPIELELPIQSLPKPGTTIHQLAARSAIQELEEGRGWIRDAKRSSDGKLLRDTYASRMDQLVEREAVRLGVQFQVGGKWSSFVAVEEKDGQLDSSSARECDYENGGNDSDDEPLAARSRGGDKRKIKAIQRGMGPGGARRMASGGPPPAAPSARAAPVACFSAARRSVGGAPVRMQKMAMAMPLADEVDAEEDALAEPAGGARFGNSYGVSANDVSRDRRRGTEARAAFGAAASSTVLPPAPPPGIAFAPGGSSSLFGAAPSPKKGAPLGPQMQQEATMDVVGKMHQLIDAQSFEGCWHAQSFPWDGMNTAQAELQARLGALGALDAVLASAYVTAVAIIFLEKQVGKEKDTWELVVEKARGWMEVALHEQKRDEVWNMVESVYNRSGKLFQEA